MQTENEKFVQELIKSAPKETVSDVNLTDLEQDLQKQTQQVLATQISPPPATYTLIQSLVSKTVCNFRGMFHANARLIHFSYPSLSLTLYLRKLSLMRA